MFSATNALKQEVFAKTRTVLWWYQAVATPLGIVHAILLPQSICTGVVWEPDRQHSLLWWAGLSRHHVDLLALLSEQLSLCSHLGVKTRA